MGIVASVGTLVSLSYGLLEGEPAQIEPAPPVQQRPARTAPFGEIIPLPANNLGRRVLVGFQSAGPSGQR